MVITITLYSMAIMLVLLSIFAAGMYFGTRDTGKAIVRYVVAKMSPAPKPAATTSTTDIPSAPVSVVSAPATTTTTPSTTMMPAGKAV